MVAIPLLSGITMSEVADFNQVYPINLEPVQIENGISNGYVRSAGGAVTMGTGPGIDRGGINWNGTLYRVMGTKLVSVAMDGTVTTLGDVGAGGMVAMDYGFDRLAIQSGTSLYYWNGTQLTQVTDTDLGPCLDVVWMDGYYISTDGTNIIVTDLSDPMSVDPLKYGSAEADPDMVTGLLRLRSELYVLGQNTIQIYTDQGGTVFPFAVNPGATIPIGCVGPRAKCLFSQTFAFCGSGRNHAPAIWLADGGSALKLSTRAVDDMLAEVADLSTIQLEARVSRDEQRLYVHLPDRTLVYLQKASTQADKPVWFVCSSGRGMDKAYRPRNAVLAYGQWWVGDTDTGAVGVLDDATPSHFGEAVGWQFITQLLYNQTNSAIVHSLELVGLPGRHQSVPEPGALLSYSLDGQTWSMERANSLGKPGNRRKRVVFNIHKRFRNYITFRFRGDSDALASWAALEAEIEPLNA